MRLRGNIRVFRLLVPVVLSACILTACTTSTPRPPLAINSRIYSDSVTLSRVLVLAGPKFRDKQEDIYGPLAVSFPSLMERIFALCHVEARALRQDEPPNPDERRAVEARAQLRPNAILAITPVGGRVVHVFDQGAVRLEGQRVFELKLVSADSGQLIWEARVQYDYQGMGLPPGIVTQLRTDGVLKNCPPGEIVRQQ
jgi:hypothetical protein